MRFLRLSEHLSSNRELSQGELNRVQRALDYLMSIQRGAAYFATGETPDSLNDVRALDEFQQVCPEVPDLETHVRILHRVLQDSSVPVGVQSTEDFFTKLSRNYFGADVSGSCCY